MASVASVALTMTAYGTGWYDHPFLVAVAHQSLAVTLHNTTTLSLPSLKWRQLLFFLASPCYNLMLLLR